MYRTAFGGTVKGRIIQATSTGVWMQLTTGEVRIIDGANLDPIKGRTYKTLPGGRRKKIKTAQPAPKAVKVKSANPAAATRKPADKLNVVERTMSDFDRLRAKGLLTSVDRTQYADK